jgi:hypothetical protein
MFNTFTRSPLVRTIAFSTLLLGTFLNVRVKDVQAAVTVYTNRTAWENALNGVFVEEDFSDGLFDDFSFGSESGLGEVREGVYFDRVRPNQSTTFSYLNAPPRLQAFGGDWNLAGRANPGIGIQVILESGVTQTVPVEIPSNYNFDFFGVISTIPFLDIVLEGGTQPSNRNRETFELDNVVYAPATPEPTTVLGLLTVGGLGLARKRKKHP